MKLPALVVVPYKQSLLISIWLPVCDNEFFRKNSQTCSTDNELYYLILLPGWLGDELTKTQETGVYQKALFQASDEHRNASSITQINAPGESANLFSTQQGAGTTVESVGTGVLENVDANTMLAQPVNHLQLPDTYSANDAQTAQDLSNFLARPYLLQSGQFQNSDSALSISGFTDINLLSDIMTLDFYKSKVKGFLGIKATTVFTLVTNATRFQQGRYILAVVHTGGVSAKSTAGADWVKMHTYTIAQTTQLPHVEIDIACDTKAQLRIPYMSAETYWNTSANSGQYCSDYGLVRLAPYSSLSAGSGSTVCDWKLYVHFEDLIVHGPCQPQSGWNPSEKEAKANGMGPISGPLLTLSQAAGVVSRIPSISSFAGTAQWALNAASLAAAAFGLSRPLNIDFTSRVQRFIMPHMQNVDAIDNTMPLSLMQGAAVDALPGFAGNDTDELSMDFFKSLFSYFTVATWSDGTAAGTSLMAINMAPSQFAAPATTDNGVTNVISDTPLSFLGKRFNMWRGSIRLRFKFVKTEFHSGRLLLTYAPIDNRNGSSASGQYTNQNYLLRHIIDIRECNEITFTIPYINGLNYLESDKPCGVITLWILDALKAPTSVTSSISILAECAGGPDLEFFMPIEYSYTPYIPSTSQSGWEPTGCGMGDVTIGGSSITVSDNHARACVGEKITSLRQMTKFWSRMGPYASATPKNYSIYFWPYMNPDSKNSGSMTYSQSVVLPDWISLLSHMFALSRGKVRIHTFPSTGGITNSWVAAQTISSAPSVFVTAAASIASPSGIPIMRTDPTLSGIISFECPAWGQTPSRANAGLLDQSLCTTVWGSYHPNYVVVQTTGASDVWTIYRNAGEDWTVGGFVGIPPMVITSHY